MDLSLVPIKELTAEIERRSVCMVLGFQTYESKEKRGEMLFVYGKGNHHQAIVLSTLLQNDVMNNWNNEMVYLQRIAEEGLS